VLCCTRTPHYVRFTHGGYVHHRLRADLVTSRETSARSPWLPMFALVSTLLAVPVEILLPVTLSLNVSRSTGHPPEGSAASEVCVSQSLRTCRTYRWAMANLYFGFFVRLQTPFPIVLSSLRLLFLELPLHSTCRDSPKPLFHRFRYRSIRKGRA